MRVYLDSCLWIYAVEDPAGKGRSVLDRLLADIESQDILLSHLIRMECLVEPIRTQHADLVNQYEGIWALGDVADLTRADFDLAAKLRANFRLKTPDALHLAVAATNRCDELWTNDSRLSSVATGVTVRRVQ